MTAKELFEQGSERLHNYYDNPYCGAREIHSVDYERMIVEEYYLPAAQQGYAPAMKACGDYYVGIDTVKAALFYKRYIDSGFCSKYEKISLWAKLGLKKTLMQMMR